MNASLASARHHMREGSTSFAQAPDQHCRPAWMSDTLLDKVKYKACQARGLLRVELDAVLLVVS